MDCPARAFTKLTETEQYKYYVRSSNVEFHSNRKTKLNVKEGFYVSKVLYLHCTDCHQTHHHSINYYVHYLHRNLSKSDLNTPN